MKKYPAIYRLTLIKEYISGIYRTKRQIISYLEENEHSISDKTLERDLKILKEMDYEIEYYPNKGYIIKQVQQFENELLQRFSEIAKIKEIFSKESEILDYVLDTSTEMQGIELITELFTALKQKRIIEFIYLKFNSNEQTLRRVVPLWLKEADERWYLIGVETVKKEIRTFGLDRMSGLKILNAYAKEIITEDIIEQTEAYKYMIGITRPTFKLLKPELIKLAVSNFLLDYWKAKPIHVTQKITEIKKDDYTLVELNVIPNIDLIKLIVSGMGDIKLLAPEKLKTYIKKKYKGLLNNILIH